MEGTCPLTSVVLATINEREALPALIESIDQLGIGPHELLVVDDGSTDGTREYVQGTSVTRPHVRLVTHEGRRTLSPAQAEGVEKAVGEYVVVMDADLQHPTDAIPQLLRELERGADLVVASRYASGGSAGPRPVIRSVISRGAEMLAKAILPEARALRDPLSGFFAFRRSALPTVSLPEHGYKLLLPLLVLFHTKRVVEVPYIFRTRTTGMSKITSSIRFIPIFLSEILIARRFRSSFRVTSTSGALERGAHSQGSDS